MAIDADVTELAVPGVTGTEPALTPHRDAASVLLGADELRQAGTGRQSRTAEHRSSVDDVRREELARDAEEADEAEPPNGS